MDNNDHLAGVYACGWDANPNANYPDDWTEDIKFRQHLDFDMYSNRLFTSLNISEDSFCVGLELMQGLHLTINQVLANTSAKPFLECLVRTRLICFGYTVRKDLEPSCSEVILLY